MRDHVMAVVKALDNSLEQARTAVAMIVGRDPASLDGSGVARAALSSRRKYLRRHRGARASGWRSAGFPELPSTRQSTPPNSMLGHRSGDTSTLAGPPRAWTIWSIFRLRA
jgi:adenosylcobinamide-phosphate synthase